MSGERAIVFVLSYKGEISACLYSIKQNAGQKKDGRGFFVSGAA